MQPRNTLAALPLALGLASQAFHSAATVPPTPPGPGFAALTKGTPTTVAKPRKGTPKEFTIPVANLSEWAKAWWCRSTL